MRNGAVARGLDTLETQDEGVVTYSPRMTLPRGGGAPYTNEVSLVPVFTKTNKTGRSNTGIKGSKVEIDSRMFLLRESGICKLSDKCMEILNQNASAKC